MKTLKKTFCLLFTFMMVLSCCLISSVRVNAGEIQTVERANANVNPEVYKISNKYNYRLKKAFEQSPDTMEAWLKLSSDSLGGTIMGNQTYTSQRYSSFYWEIDAIGRVVIYWNNGEWVHTFNNKSVSDGTWHHVAFVRDKVNNTVAVYVDGKLEDSVNYSLNESVCDMVCNIGVDFRNWTQQKNPLDGEIKQVTVYGGAISASRIKEDMLNREITENYENVKLLGNWYLGEQWTERNVADTSANHNDAYITTFEKYVGVVDTGEYDYSFAVFPDIQAMVHYRPTRAFAQTRWLANNALKLKMKFAMFVGDLSDVGRTEKFYEVASMAMSNLDGIVPYSFVQGNHDYDDDCSLTRSSNYFDTYFPYSYHSTLPGFGGAFEEGTMANTYYRYEIGEIKYLILNLEFGPRASVLRWAGRICEKFKDHRVIINTHSYVEPDGNLCVGMFSPKYSYWKSSTTESTDSIDMFNGLVKKYPNIMLVFNGHYPLDEVVYRNDTGDFGNNITSILVNTQCTRYNGEEIGEDPLLICRVNEKKKTISYCLYSPEYDACLNIQNQFTLSFADANNPTI